MIDSAYFGKLTFTFWNFLYFNFLSEGSQFYGRQPWHWVVSEGLPVVFASYLPGLVVGMALNRRKMSFWAYLFFLAVISLSPHKEYRFLLSSFPHAINLMCCDREGGFGARFRYLLAFVQVCLGLFLSLYHQVGPLALMDTLQSISPSSISFYINCHGTPFYSHLHSPIPMKFLQCRPL